MLNLLSNTACNNMPFISNTIPGMHESMERLYKIALAREGIRRQTDVAAALNESPQAVKNWETRGISKDGALKAQARFGCDANWLLVDGPAASLPALSVEEPTPIYFDGAKRWSWPFSKVTPQQYELLTDKEQQHLEEDIILRIEGRDSKQETPEEDVRRRHAAA